MKKTMVLLMTIAFVFTFGSAFGAETKTASKLFSNGITFFDLGPASPSGVATESAAAIESAVVAFNGITFFDQKPGSGVRGAGAGGSAVPGSTGKPAYNGITVF
jgi:hypothetical protein